MTNNDYFEMIAAFVIFYNSYALFSRAVFQRSDLRDLPKILL